MSLGTIGDRLFFSAIDASGVELWKSDGTFDSTTRVKDIAEGFTTEGSNPRLLVAFKGRVYFATRANGPESVWVSDGTAGSTTALPIQSADLGVVPKLAGCTATVRGCVPFAVPSLSHRTASPVALAPMK
jgi:ELWxxDGT repeat protein